MLLLADVFENFRKVYQDKYRLDPANCYSSLGQGWYTLLKKTGVELELLTDPDRERDERGHLDSEQMLRKGEQPAGRRI